MNTMVSNLTNTQAEIQPVKSAQLVAVFKSIVPRSFEKTFDGMPTEAINTAMKICIDGLTRDQINLGLAQVRDNGFCPDLAMFRKWCLGVVGFGTEQQRAIDSFKGRNAALANIVKWRGNENTKITTAEREAYVRSIELFQVLNTANNYERSAYYAYEAFKENYMDVVKEFVEQGLTQEIWKKPDVIEPPVRLPGKPESKLDQHTPEQEKWLKAKTKELVDTGLSYPVAMFKAMSEMREMGKVA
ncbi:hypothetical protein [Acinetobacter rathckeae]|uniref:hypothetical protein n=1 Tax=Acinetobacter rathckeae TaxID=2605272 RepID=UPI0038994394